MASCPNGLLLITLELCFVPFLAFILQSLESRDSRGGLRHHSLPALGSLGLWRNSDSTFTALACWGFEVSFARYRPLFIHLCLGLIQAKIQSHLAILDFGIDWCFDWALGLGILAIDDDFDSIRYQMYRLAAGSGQRQPVMTALVEVLRFTVAPAQLHFGLPPQ